MGNSCGKKPDNIHKEIILTDQSRKYSSRWDVDFKDIEDKYNILKNFPLYEYLYLLLNHKNDTTTEEFERKIDEPISAISYEKFLTNKIAKHHLIVDTFDEQDFHLYEDYFKKVYDNVLLYAQWIRNDESINVLKKIDLVPFAILNCAATFEVKANLFYALFSQADGTIANTRELMEFVFILLATPSAVSYLSLKDINGLYPGKIAFKADAESLMNATEHKDYKSLMSATLKDYIGKKDARITKDEYFQKVNNFDWMFSYSGIRKTLDESNEERDRLKKEKESQVNNA